MDKMGYPKGLISFTSEEELAGGKTHILRPKLIGYFVVLVVMTGLLFANIWMRSPTEVDIIRDRNSLYRETNEGLIENVYTIKVLNKTQQTQTYSIAVKGLPDYKYIGEQTVTVEGGAVYSTPISVATDAYNLEDTVTDIFISVTTTIDGESVTVDEPTKFLYR